jgi:predicted DNA-binding transcriptional regulator YafY
LRKRLHRDLEHIRHSLDIQLYADRRSGDYVIRDMESPLLDLPDDNLATIAWLEQTFTTNAPSYREVRAFLERLRFYLAPERRLKIEEHRTALVVDLGQRDEDTIRPEVEVGLAQALARRRRVEFDYLSPQAKDGQLRRHLVDIYEPSYFDTVRRHYYVRGWCQYIVGPTGESQMGDYITYRLGRMSNFQLLPQKLPPSPPVGRRYPVRYWLAPDVARSGVTYRQWIHIEHIEKQADESVIVHGSTESIFWAVQELMHYRHNCRVLGGSEMLEAMAETVKKMAELYEDGETYP